MRKSIRPTFKRVDHRGTLIEVVNAGHWRTLLYGQMKRGAVLGNHYHKKTDVFFFLQRGKAKVTVVRVHTGRRTQMTLPPGRGVLLRSNDSHAIRFLENAEFIILKSRRYHPHDPDTFAFPVEVRADGTR